MFRVSPIAKVIGFGFIAASLLVPSLSRAGSILDGAIRNFESNSNYIQPFATMFGSITNSGWYQSAWEGKGFGFYIGVPMNLTYVASADRTFEATWVDDGCVEYHQDTVAHQQTSNCHDVTSYKAPTIFGGKAPANTLHIYDPNYSHSIVDSVSIAVNDGISALSKLEALPFAMPQVGFSFYYTEVKLRYLMLPSLSLGSGSKVSFNMPGIGIQHDLRSVFSKTLPFTMPVDISLVGNMTWFSAQFTPGDSSTVGKLKLNASSYFYGLLCGYTYHFMEVFLETGWEGATLKTGGNLTLEANSSSPETISPDLSVEGRNGFRAAVNVAFHLGYDVVGGQNFGSELGQQVNVLAYRYNHR